MIATKQLAGYSAEVRIRLHIGGQCIPVCQIGPDQLILDRPMTLPAVEGQVVVHVDEHERRWHVKFKSTVQTSRIVEAEFSDI